MRRIAVIAVACVSAAVGNASAATDATRWFHSPSGNVQCELAGTYAYCQTFAPARSVRLTAKSAFRVCRGIGCIGNGPENSVVLRYGSSLRVGPFSCTSLTSGMRCIVVASRHGFAISREAVRRV